MPDWERDGSTDRLFFTITKDGAGVDLQFGVQLVNGDIHLYQYFPVAGIVKRQIAIASELIKVDSIDAPGELMWQPQSGDLRCNAASLVIRDADGGGLFDENRVRVVTHGRYNPGDIDDSSRFKGI